MTISIELPPEEERTLVERARLSGRDLATYVRGILRHHLQDSAGASLEGEEGLLDDEAIAYCEKEADDAITLEEVRASTSRIKDSMARMVIEEVRAERF